LGPSANKKIGHIVHVESASAHDLF